MLAHWAQSHMGVREAAKLLFKARGLTYVGRSVVWEPPLALRGERRSDRSAAEGKQVECRPCKGRKEKEGWHPGLTAHRESWETARASLQS